MNSASREREREGEAYYTFLCHCKKKHFKILQLQMAFSENRDKIKPGLFSQLRQLTKFELSNQHRR